MQRPRRIGRDCPDLVVVVDSKVDRSVVCDRKVRVTRQLRVKRLASFDQGRRWIVVRSDAGDGRNRPVRVDAVEHEHPSLRGLRVVKQQQVTVRREVHVARGADRDVSGGHAFRACNGASASANVRVDRQLVRLSSKVASIAERRADTGVEVMMVREIPASEPLLVLRPLDANRGRR